MENRIQYLPNLLSIGIDNKQFCFAQSAWLAALDLRKNSDLDIVIHPSVFTRYKKLIDHMKNVDLKINSKKFKELGCINDTELFDKYVIEINGFLFSNLSFYVNLLNKRLKDGIKVDKTKQILELLKNYFKEYNENYVISKEKFQEIKQDVYSYFI